MSHENVQVIQGLYEAFGRGDVPTVLGRMDPSIEWNEAENFIYADRNPYVGDPVASCPLLLGVGQDSAENRL